MFVLKKNNVADMKHSFSNQLLINALTFCFQIKLYALTYLKQRSKLRACFKALFLVKYKF